MPDPSPTPTSTVTPSVTPTRAEPSVTDTPAATPTVTPSVTPTRAVPSVTPTASVYNLDTLIAEFPELDNSLTLNPAQSALMLDPELRAREIKYARHARQGEFGYNVRRRLHNGGYNV